MVIGLSAQPGFKLLLLQQACPVKVAKCLQCLCQVSTYVLYAGMIVRQFPQADS